MAKAKTKRGETGLDPALLIKAVGVKGIIAAVGLERIVQTAAFRRGFRRFIREKGVEWLVARMSPEQRRELKEYLT